MSSNGGQVELNPTIDFIAGTIAGIASLIVGFPFDTIKVRFQSPAIAGKYHSTFHAITTIIREERFIGLYKGITSPLATVALMNGLVFASYRFLLKLQLPMAETVPTITQIALAGAGCGIVSSIVTTPTELIKIRQQSTFTPTNARQVALNIFRENGIKGLYRGMPVTAMRDCGYGAYFAAYEATCRCFATDGANVFARAETEITTLSWPALLLAGGVAGVAGWIATFPLDVVKTRVQGSQAMPTRVPVLVVAGAHSGGVASLSPSTPLLDNLRPPSPVVQDFNPYRTTWTTIVHSYRNEGPSVFFRGLSPTLIRAIPVNMATFATFEFVVHALS